MTLDLFSPEMRRNPFPAYAHLRATSPVLHDPGTGLWLVFDYDDVRTVLSDHEAFSSRVGPPEWMNFQDPPRHTKLRALVAKAFTPRSIANLEQRIRTISRELLDKVAGRGEMDLALDYAVPLPMRVIGDMLGIPQGHRARFVRWNDVLLRMSYTVGASKSEPAAAAAIADFITITDEMNAYVEEQLAERRASAVRNGEPDDDLLTRLAAAEVDGERLTHRDILGFFQLLLLAGSETTTNLINNAILCFLENPDQLALVRMDPELMPSVIEEVLRYRSPVQWMFRRATRDTEMGGGVVIPAGKVVLAVIGSANRDPRYFQSPEQFDVRRDPNPHLAFGVGMHFCLGASLARLEARVALPDLLKRIRGFRLASDEPWPPRNGLHVYGPSRLPIRFEK